MLKNTNNLYINLEILGPEIAFAKPLTEREGNSAL